MTTPNLGKLKILVPEPVTGQGRDINFNFRVIAGEIDLLDAHLINVGNPHQTTLEQILNQNNDGNGFQIKNIANASNEQDATTLSQIMAFDYASKDYVTEQIKSIAPGFEPVTDGGTDEDTVSDTGDGGEDISSESLTSNIRKITGSSYDIATSDRILLAEATGNDIVLNLPAASSSAGVQFNIKKIDDSSNIVTVLPSGSDTIDGAAGQILSQQYVNISIISDGSGWYIL